MSGETTSTSSTSSGDFYIDLLGMTVADYAALSDDDRNALVESLIEAGVSEDEIKSELDSAYEDIYVARAEAAEVASDEDADTGMQATAQYYVDLFDTMLSAIDDFSTTWGNAQDDHDAHFVDTTGLSSYTVAALEDPTDGEEITVYTTNTDQDITIEIPEGATIGSPPAYDPETGDTRFSVTTEDGVTYYVTVTTEPLDSSETSATESSIIDDPHADDDSWVDTDGDGMKDIQADTDGDGIADVDTNHDNIITEADMQSSSGSTTTGPANIYISGGTGGLTNDDLQSWPDDLLAHTFITDTSTEHSLYYYTHDGSEPTTESASGYYSKYNLDDLNNTAAITPSDDDFANGREYTITCESGKTDNIELNFGDDVDLTFTIGDNGELIITATNADDQSITITIENWEANYVLDEDGHFQELGEGKADVITINGGDISDESINDLYNVGPKTGDAFYDSMFFGAACAAAIVFQGDNENSVYDQAMEDDVPLSYEA